MAVKEIRDYLENGNIKNSVNNPNCDMGTCVAVGRISLAHSNTPNMISQVTKILGSEGLNIADMTNKSKGEFAYTLIDLESAASAKALDELKEIEGMYRVRVVRSAWVWRTGVWLTCVCMRRCWERKVEPMEENGLTGLLRVKKS